MAKRKVSFVIGEYYHLYNRGNSKRVLFHDEQDYDRFISLLFLSNTSANFKVQYLGKKKIFNVDNRMNQIVAIGAWALMPNHFHLLVTPLIDHGISKYMQKLTTAYVMYYNQKYHHSGGLYEGKFKSEHAHEDRFLKYLFSYIHLNCIKLIDPKWRTKSTKSITRYVSYLSNYRYSSYRDYIDIFRPELLILDKNAFPPYFIKKNAVEREMFDWLSYRQDL